MCAAGWRDLVVLSRIRRHIGEDGHLVDVGILLGVDVFEFRMERRIAGAGRPGIAFGNLGEGIPLRGSWCSSHLLAAMMVRCWGSRWLGVRRFRSAQSVGMIRYIRNALFQRGMVLQCDHPNVFSRYEPQFSISSFCKVGPKEEGDAQGKARYHQCPGMG